VFPMIVLRHSFSHYRCGYFQEQGWITCEINQDAIKAFQCCSINIANGDQSALSHHLKIACTQCNARGETCTFPVTWGPGHVGQYYTRSCFINQDNMNTAVLPYTTRNASAKGAMPQDSSQPSHSHSSHQQDPPTAPIGSDSDEDEDRPLKKTKTVVSSLKVRAGLTPGTKQKAHPVVRLIATPDEASLVPAARGETVSSSSQSDLSLSDKLLVFVLFLSFQVPALILLFFFLTESFSIKFLDKKATL